MMIEPICTFCKSWCETSITDLSRKANQKLNRCVNSNCKAIMNRIPLNAKEIKNA